MCPSTPAVAACAVAAGSRIPLELTGNTMAEADDFAPTCMGRDGGRDIAFQFTAPDTGRYHLPTVGPSFDPGPSRAPDSRRRISAMIPAGPRSAASTLASSQGNQCDHGALFQPA